jgi:hypothetical protein
MYFTSLLFIHLIGLSIGLGAATIADLSLIRSLRHGRAASSEFLRISSYCVWIGLALLTVSGVNLFALSPSTYLASSGFVAKMVIVGVLLLNGFFLQRQGTEWAMNKNLLVMGAVSVTSWYGSLAAALFKNEVSLPLQVWLLAYIAGTFASWMILRLIFRRSPRSREA